MYLKLVVIHHVHHRDSHSPGQGSHKAEPENRERDDSAPTRIPSRNGDVQRSQRGKE